MTNFNLQYILLEYPQYLELILVQFLFTSLLFFIIIFIQNTIKKHIKLILVF